MHVTYLSVSTIKLLRWNCLLKHAIEGKIAGRIEVTGRRRRRGRNYTTAAIQERVTAVLRSIPTEAFADSFQKLYERCQPCVVKDGDYFEGE
jgi:hypothetical protein